MPLTFFSSEFIKGGFYHENEGFFLVKIVVGKTEYINGSIVNDDTRITAGGKDATINDIKIKDRVTMVLKMKNNGVYVKKITKK